MRNAKSRIYAAAIGVLSMGAAAAWAAEPNAQDVKIQELEAKVAALETKQAANSKDLAATIETVLRDAERRTQLLATSGDTAAGYKDGFFISAGPDWELRPGAFFQFRNVSNFRSEVGPNESDQFQNGFEVRRMQLSLEGHAFSKDLTYCFIWDTDDNSGNVFLEDAWAKYMFADEWGVRAGQFKDPVSHEWLVADGRQLAVERSLIDALLGGGLTGWTQGVSLIYGGMKPNSPINAEVAFTDGANQANTNFVGRAQPLADVDPTVPPVGQPLAHGFDWGVGARVEWMAMGNSWLPYKDFTAKDNKADFLVIGAGGDWSQAGDGNQWIATLDATYKNGAGLSIYAAGLYRHLDAETMLDVTTGAAGHESNDNFGFLVQAGYMINQQWEVFGRYDYTRVDFDAAGPASDLKEVFHEITLGVNYYLGANGSAGHRAKITVDLSYLPSGAPGAAPGLGILDNNERQAEWILRGQFQLWI